MSSYATPLFATEANEKATIRSGITSSEADFTKCIDLYDNTDQFLRQIRVPKVSDMTFVVDNVLFQSRITPMGDNADLIIWAELGYLPYTVTSMEKRNNMIAILEASRALQLVKIGVDDTMKIIASGHFRISTPPTPNYIFEPLITFLQEARPFMKLIGEYL